MQSSVNGLLLVTDMDGTMLTTDKHISNENIAAIRAFQKAGGRFSIATGRSIPSLEHYVHLLQIDTPVILYNGGAIYDYDKREILWHSILSENAELYVRDVYEKFPEIGIEILLDGQIYVARTNAIVKKHLDTEQLSYTICKIEEAPKGWFKVLFALEPSRMDEFENYMLSKGYNDVCFVRSFTHYFEMLPLGSSKGGALCHLAEITGIPLKQTVAIGDYFNDLEMIQNAGMGVAVANAPQELKDAAELVVCDNDHHAIAELINYLMNQSIFER